MFITFSWRSRWSRVQAAMLSFIVQGRVRRRHMRLVSPVQLMQEQVRQVAATSVATRSIWQVEDCLEIKAHIACWHRCICTYRGYVLCSDASASERTFLMDTRTWTYVTITKAGLLQIDGVNQAKAFVDALCDLQERGGSYEADCGKQFSRQFEQSAAK